MFEYHGAEHKVVFNFESRPAGDRRERADVLNVPSALRHQFPAGGDAGLDGGLYAALPFDAFLLKLVGRVVLLPVIAGLSYEIIRFAAKRRSGLLAAVTAPGLWLQRITTQPPADDQAAVAICALEGAMELEETQGGELVIA